MHVGRHSCSCVFRRRSTRRLLLSVAQALNGFARLTLSGFFHQEARVPHRMEISARPPAPRRATSIIVVGAML